MNLDSPMYIIFDTGILISACIYPERKIAHIYLNAVSHYSIVASEATLSELGQVLSRTKFNKWRTIEERIDWYNKFKARVKICPVTATISDCPDPKDNIFLELAVSAKAPVIIASDPHLLDMHPYKGIQVLNATDFNEKYLLGFSNNSFSPVE